ncbi:MAG: dihydroneopterin aldolase [Clostridia bacterium]
MSDRIVVRDMEFYAYHGVFEAEREIGQRFEVDVELHLDLRSAAQADDIDQSINYVDVYTAIKEIVEEQEFRLIESLAEAIAEVLLSAYDLEAVVVRVRKPSVPIGGIVGEVEVEITRTPADLRSPANEEL